LLAVADVREAPGLRDGYPDKAEVKGHEPLLRLGIVAKVERCN